MITILASILITWLLMLAFADDMNDDWGMRALALLLSTLIGGLVGFVVAGPVLGLCLLPTGYHEVARTPATQLTYGQDGGRAWVRVHYKDAAGWNKWDFHWADEVEWREGKSALVTEEFGAKESWYWLIGFADLNGCPRRKALCAPAGFKEQVQIAADKGLEKTEVAGK
jgi:hypothetical protein